jgi:hypothetical protein
MPNNWKDLSVIVSRSEYNATFTDRHYQATAPLEPLPCRCDRPGFALDPDDDDGEVRCWKYGARPPDRP